jgi:hypothetical protein
LLVVATTLLVLTESTASCVVPALIIPKLVAPSKPLTVASSKICTVSTEPFVPFLPATTVPILLPPAVLFLAAHDARTPSKSTLLSMQAIMDITPTPLTPNLRSPPFFVCYY